MSTRKHSSYTIVIPVTNRNPVPAGAVVTPRPDGSAIVQASRRTDRRHLHLALFHRFGDRTGWPFARGRRWIVEIAPLEVPVPTEAQVAA